MQSVQAVWPRMKKKWKLLNKYAVFFNVKYLSHTNSIIFPIIIFFNKVIVKNIFVKLNHSTIFSTKCSTILQFSRGMGEFGESKVGFY